MTLEKPDLYDFAPEGTRLVLRAGRCSDCGALSFPFPVYGCSKCGTDASAVKEEMLDARAPLLSFATVHVALVPGLSPPVTVGEIEVLPGQIEEIMIDAPEEALSVGMMVQAVARDVERNGQTVTACRFVPAGDQT